MDIWSVKLSLIGLLKLQWKQMSIYLGRFYCERHLRCPERVCTEREEHTQCHLSLLDEHSGMVEVLNRPAVVGRGELTGMILAQEMNLELEAKINMSVLLISKVENKVETEERQRLEEKWSI